MSRLFWCPLGAIEVQDGNCTTRVSPAAAGNVHFRPKADFGRTSAEAVVVLPSELCLRLMVHQPLSVRDLAHLMDNRARVGSEKFGELLDEIVKLDGCGWELGPDFASPASTALAFSALCERRTIDRLEEELGLPLFGGDWSVVIGVPPRHWERYFEYVASDGQSHAIEGSKWQYNLTRENDRIAIELCVPSSLPIDLFNEVARILCVGELGELNLIEFVSRISYGLSKTDAKPIQLLRADFVSHFPQCHYAGMFEEAP